MDDVSVEQHSMKQKLNQDPKCAVEEHYDATEEWTAQKLIGIFGIEASALFLQAVQPSHLVVNSRCHENLGAFFRYRLCMLATNIMHHIIVTARAIWSVGLWEGRRQWGSEAHQHSPLISPVVRPKIIPVPGAVWVRTETTKHSTPTNQHVLK